MHAVGKRRTAFRTLRRYYGTLSTLSTILEIRKRNLRIIDCSNGDWNSDAVKKAYRLIDNIKKYDLYIEPDAYKVNSYRFWELAIAQSPYVQLFLFLCFADRLDYHKLFAVSMKEIEEAAQKASELEEMRQTAQSTTE
jgi:hypothetical protein